MPNAPNAPREFPAPEDPSSLSDPLEFAPHLVFLKELVRLDEAMANGRDAWDAFDCWRSGLRAWARKDPVFQAEAKGVRAYLRKKQRHYAAVPRNVIINAWRPAYIDVMRRAGMFNRVDAANNSAGTARDGAALDAVKRKVTRQ